jgi:hypothetical protein
MSAYAAAAASHVAARKTRVHRKTRLDKKVGLHRKTSVPLSCRVGHAIVTCLNSKTGARRVPMPTVPAETPHRRRRLRACPGRRGKVLRCGQQVEVVFACNAEID